MILIFSILLIYFKAVFAQLQWPPPQITSPMNTANAASYGNSNRFPFQSNSLPLNAISGGSQGGDFPILSSMGSMNFPRSNFFRGRQSPQQISPMSPPQNLSDVSDDNENQVTFQPPVQRPHLQLPQQQQPFRNYPPRSFYMGINQQSNQTPFHQENPRQLGQRNYQPINSLFHQNLPPPQSSRLEQQQTINNSVQRTPAFISHGGTSMFHQNLPPQQPQHQQNPQQNQELTNSSLLETTTTSSSNRSSLPNFLDDAQEEIITEFKRIIRQRNVTYDDKMKEVELLVSNNLDETHRKLYHQFMNETDKTQQTKRDAIHKTVEGMSEEAQKEFTKISEILQNSDFSSEEEKWNKILTIYGNLEPSLRNEFEDKFKSLV